MRSVVLLLILGVAPSVALGQPAGKQRPVEPLPPGAAFRLGSYQFWQDGAVGALALSPDGKVLASSSATAGRPIGKFHGQTKLGRGFRLWDTETGEAHPRPDPAVKDEVLDLGYSADGKWLASATATEIQLWNTATARIVRRIPMPGMMSNPIARVAFSPDGSFLHATRNEHNRLAMDAFRWEAHTGKLLKTWRDRVAPVEAGDEEKTNSREGQVSLAISPDGKRLFKGFKVPRRTSDKDATAHDDPIVPTSLRIYDAASGKRVHQIDDLNVDLSSLVFSADGKLFAFSGANAVYVGAVENPSPLRKIDGSAEMLALSRDGTRLAAVQSGGALCCGTSTPASGSTNSAMRRTPTTSASPSPRTGKRWLSATPTGSVSLTRPAASNGMAGPVTTAR
jgi:WD40 repeat protein